MGAAIVGVAVYVKNSDTTKIASEALPNGLLAIGALVMTISFLGCCGALRESRCLLFLYALLLFVLILAQLVVAGLILTDSGKAEDVLSDGWNEQRIDDPQVIRDLQNQFDCCGFTTIAPGVEDGSVSPCPPAPAATTPCFDKLKDEFNSRARLLGGFGVALALMEIFGLIFAICLRTGIKTREEEDIDDLEDARRVNRSYQN
jgi:CD63 antigen